MEKQFTVDQVADYLHLHRKTILRYINANKINATRIGHKWLISESEIKRLLA